MGIGLRCPRRRAQRLLKRLVCLRLVILPHTRADKITEQWMWTIRAAFKFGMELRGDKPGMIDQFDNLDQAVIRRAPAENHAVRLHTFAELVVKFVAMAVAFKDDRLA